MVMNMESLLNLINSTNYQMMIAKLEKSLDISVNRNSPPIAVLNYDMKKIRISDVEIEEIELLIDEEKEKIISFVSAKLSKYINAKMEQECPKGEDLDEDDEVIERVPFYGSFLVIYLLEYYLLKNKPSDVESYLKKIRIPQAKKYAKEIKKIFDDVQQA